jgi:acetoin utilization protein AcuB
MADSWPSARDLMTPKPITLTHESPLSAALGLMRSKRIHEIPVLRKGKLVGMVTFESIARRSNLPLSTKLEHIMVLPPIVTPATSFIELAQHLLAANMRAAPVVGRRGELVGLVSRTDMIQAMPSIEVLAAHRVEEIMSPTGPIILETESVGMLHGQIRALEEHPLAVIDRAGRLTGAVGLTDLGGVLWKPSAGGKRDPRTPGKPKDVEVRSIMTSPAETVPHGTTAGAAARLMNRRRISSVFVVEGGKPVGVVSQADLLGLAIGAQSPEGDNLQDVYVQVHGLRGASDPEILTEVDRVVARGLRHISLHVRPIMLSLHITPQGNHRSGDAQVAARLYTDQGIFYASITGWNFFSAIADLLDELTSQTRRIAEGSRKRRRISAKGLPVDDEPVDRELEARIRAATLDDED